MSDTIQILNKLMDSCALRQRVIAGNLANINTPGYTRREVEFQKVLSEAIRSGNDDKVAEAAPKVVLDQSGPYRRDGNNVSVQTEMEVMSDNSLLYNLATTAISRKYAGLHKAIGGK